MVTTTTRTFPVTDPAGQLLAHVELQVSEGTTAFRERGVSGGRGLLLYYYLDGGREAVLHLDGVELQGRLETGWLGGERRWWIGARRNHQGAGARAAGSGGVPAAGDPQAVVPVHPCLVGEKATAPGEQLAALRDEVATLAANLERACGWLGLEGNPAISRVISDLGELAWSRGEDCRVYGGSAIQTLYALMLRLEANEDPATAVRRACLHSDAAKGIGMLRLAIEAQTADPRESNDPAGQESLGHWKAPDLWEELGS